MSARGYQHSRRGTGAGWGAGCCGKERRRAGGRPGLVSRVVLWQRKAWDWAHQSRRSSALDMPGDAIEDGYATTHGEQQHGQQGADGPQAPWSARGMVASLCPDLLAGMAGLDIVESECDVVMVLVLVMLMVSATGRPGLSGDEGEAGQEQQDSERVQRLVEGKRVVDRRGGAQVGRC